ncbi:hypothetical protein [Rhodococcus sp. IEGM 1330]|uniref:hypothetical protein n=1 Tax=Rhodococcus sp. IEGM 1330 TaxID=3082225 RepID=UPI00295511AB|nr:hypothetical protein [Rhodococcus sp. IEGM 1330]MDV8021995.1 hypothetical protein [Rhodococcus sp. IEGM 1330]
MTIVNVDFNDVARGGKVVALRSWADAPVVVGETVQAVDRLEGLSFDAVVSEEDDASGEIYLSLIAESESRPPAEIHGVVYTYDADASPSWTYQTLPKALVGFGDDVASVRTSFKRRSARHPRPADSSRRSAVAEYVEFRLTPGFRLRYQLDSHQAERRAAAEAFVKTTRHALLTRWDIARMGLTASGDAVVVAALPDDTIDSVLEQMDPEDNFVITLAMHDRVRDHVVSLVSGVSREHAKLPVGRRMETLKAAGLSASSTVEQLMKASGVDDKLSMYDEGASKLQARTLYVDQLIGRSEFARHRNVYANHDLLAQLTPLPMLGVFESDASIHN